MNQLVSFSAIVTTVDAVLLAEIARSPSVPLLQRLDPAQRVGVIAALVVIITFGGLLLLLVRTGGRFARWYIDQPVCRSPRGGFPCGEAGGAVGKGVGRSPEAEPTPQSEAVGTDQNTRPMSSSDTLAQDARGKLRPGP